MSGGARGRASGWTRGRASGRTPGRVAAAALAGAVALAAGAGVGCKREAAVGEGGAGGAAGGAMPGRVLDGASPAPAPAPAAADVTAASPAAGAGCTLPRAPWRFPAVPRVVAVGDVHGDRAAFQRVLARAGLVDGDLRWTGGTTWLVQTGDILDRGDDEQAILDDLERLEDEAAAAGGRVVWLNGNHEVMNAAGDLRYVTPGGFADFEDVPGLDRARFAAAPEVARARLAAFAPGGPYAQVLAGQNLVAVVGDTAFAHGGIAPGAAAGLDDANHATRCWLAGQGPPPAVIEDSHGPVWNRTFGFDDVDCDLLRRVLAELDVARLVIGHTTQPGGVTTRCHGALWRIDVGLARHYGGPSQAIEITASGVKVLR